MTINAALLTSKIIFMNSVIPLFSFIKLLNVALRIGSIGSKFLVFTLLSKHFSDIIFGGYSLITSLITILIYALGLDFYTFSIRNILTTKSLFEIRNKVATAVIFYGIIYFFFTLIGYVIFNQIPYIKSYVFLIIGLCITEHLSQEIYRMLIGFEKILLANVLLFIRTMGWSLIVFYYILNKVPISIEIIFKLWLIANTMTIVYIIFLLIKNNYLYLNEIEIDFLWIKRGIKICSIFFIGTIFLKMIEYSNRFIVDYYLGKQLAGIFTFYSSISILITVYIETVVISFNLPKLIKFANTNKITGLLQKFKKSLIIQTFVGSILLLLLIKPLLYWQDKVEFKNYLPLLFFMIVSVGLMNYSLFYHNKLYIFNKDKSIVKIMIICGVVNIILTVISTSLYGIYGSASAFVITGILMFYLRYKEAKKIKND